ncbi:MAG: hypothetical protein J6M39_06425 [Lachnospiraceae bacterium]|nr:hypothetical protein [Lachnospiraceae bacterium]
MEIITNNFDFGVIFSINVLVYLFIKMTESIFPNVSKIKWYKIVCTIIIGVIFGIVYKEISNIEITTLINSCICAPVIWDWVLKPILQKFKVDYKDD